MRRQVNLELFQQLVYGEAPSIQAMLGGGGGGEKQQPQHGGNLGPAMSMLSLLEETRHVNPVEFYDRSTLDYDLDPPDLLELTSAPMLSPASPPPGIPQPDIGMMNSLNTPCAFPTQQALMAAEWLRPSFRADQHCESSFESSSFSPSPVDMLDDQSSDCAAVDDISSLLPVESILPPISAEEVESILSAGSSVDSCSENSSEALAAPSMDMSLMQQHCEHNLTMFSNTHFSQQHTHSDISSSQVTASTDKKDKKKKPRWRANTKEKLEKKRSLNNKAAERYRLKKREMKQDLGGEIEKLASRNKVLRGEVSLLERQIGDFVSLLKVDRSRITAIAMSNLDSRSSASEGSSSEHSRC